MPRHSFQNTCDFIGGPLSPTPGAVVWSGSCRLVIADGIVTIGAGTPGDVAWLTEQSYDPSGPWDSSGLGYAAGFADQVAVPAGSAPQWWVTKAEKIDWKGQPTYRRANLALLPIAGAGHLTKNSPQIGAMYNLTATGQMVNNGNLAYVLPGMLVYGIGFDPPAVLLTIDYVTYGVTYDRNWIGTTDFWPLAFVDP